MATVLQRSRPARDPEALKPAIRARARALGFDVVGFAAPGLPRPIQSAYRRYLAAGRQGDMAWLARAPERRESPDRLWPEARSVIVLGMNYGPDADPLAALARRDRGAISVYAQNRDYHDLIKGRLKQLAGWLARRGSGPRPRCSSTPRRSSRSRSPSRPGSAGRASTATSSRAPSAPGCSWARS